MEHSWLTILPPTLVILFAIITGRILSALLIGILTACAIARHGAVLATMQLAFESLLDTAIDIDNIFTLKFLLIGSIKFT